MIEVSACFEMVRQFVGNSFYGTQLSVTHCGYAVEQVAIVFDNHQRGIDAGESRNWHQGGYFC
jgi:hypothetical protein